MAEVARRTIHTDEALDVARTALEVAQCTSDKIDRVLAILGTEEEDGKGGFTATGIVGRVRRVESTAFKLVRSYEGWFKTAGGFGGAIVLIAGLVTFLVSNHIVKVG